MNNSQKRYPWEVVIQHDTLALFGTLVDDVDECLELLRRGPKEEEKQFFRRMLIRSVCALIEGMVYRLKLEAVVGPRKERLDAEEAIVIKERTPFLDESGRIKWRPAYSPLDRTLTFACRLYAKTSGGTFEVDRKDEEWKQFIECVAIRNRLMHPKHPKDLEVSFEEADSAREAAAWFMEMVGKLIHIRGEALKEMVESIKAQERGEARKLETN